MKKLTTLAVAAAIIGAFAIATAPAAEKEKAKAVTVSGISGCAQCEGLASGHDIYLTLDNGLKIILKGDDESYKKAHKVRADKVKMTAVLEGQIRSGGSGDKTYLIANAASVKVES